MLILPPGHAQAASELRRLTLREKRLIRGVVAAVALLAVAVVTGLAVNGPSSGHGCIHLTLPGPVGAAAIDECGASARSTCATALRPGAFAPAFRGDVAAACRRAGLPVG